MILSVKVNLQHLASPLSEQTSEQIGFWRTDRCPALDSCFKRIKTASKQLRSKGNTWGGRLGINKDTSEPMGLRHLGQQHKQEQNVHKSRHPALYMQGGNEQGRGIKNRIQQTSSQGSCQLAILTSEESTIITDREPGKESLPYSEAFMLSCCNNVSETKLILPSPQSSVHRLGQYNALERKWSCDNPLCPTGQSSFLKYAHPWSSTNFPH